MKLIIDIPEEIYERFGYEYREENLISKHTNDIILNAFCNGIPLEQEPKTGHWIKSRDCYGNYHFTCSECGNDIATQYADNWEDKYCSDCGCRMVEPQESEVEDAT